MQRGASYSAVLILSRKEFALKLGLLNHWQGNQPQKYSQSVPWDDGT